MKCGDTVLLDLTYTHTTLSPGRYPRCAVHVSQKELICSTYVQYLCREGIGILYTYVRTYKVGKELTHGYIENASIRIQKGVGIGSQMHKVNTLDDWYHTN